MPRATHVLVEPFREEKPVGMHGWALKIDKVTAVGLTYRAKLISPDGRQYPCPTRFRRSARCYVWAKKALRGLLKHQPHYHGE